MNIKTVQIYNDVIKINGKFNIKDLETYLDIAAKASDAGRPALSMPWVFDDCEFKNLLDMSEKALTALHKLKDTVEKLPKKPKATDMEARGATLDAKQGIVVFDDGCDLYDMILFCAQSPTFWHLKLTLGDKTYKNISEVTKEKYGKLNADEFIEATHEYMDIKKHKED